MTTDKCEYDAAVGGTVELPDALQTYKYVGERVTEIKSLLNAIQNPSQTKLVFQTLPRHMRRRAMSHCPKRLPRKYRRAHISQMQKSGMSAKTKRPSRKYRRKPSNLLKEFIRRQRQHIWMETHVWHAKVTASQHNGVPMSISIPFLSAIPHGRTMGIQTARIFVRQNLSVVVPSHIKVLSHPRHVVRRLRRIGSLCGNHRPRLPETHQPAM